MKTKPEFKNRLYGQFKNLLAVRAAVLLLCLVAAPSPAQTYTILHTFTGGSDGSEPDAGLALSGATLYGTTVSGGISNCGTIFKLNTDGTGYSVLKGFTQATTDGRYPAAGLMLSGETLYGTTQASGTNGYSGTLFKINTDGNGYTVIKYLDGSDGYCPATRLVSSGNTLYGTTHFSIHCDGLVFKVNCDGSGYTVLKDFCETNYGDGLYPDGGLVVSGATLYGVTEYGGSGGGKGTVFKLNTDGSGYSILHTFSATTWTGSANTNADGAEPRMDLLLSGTTLYGTTAYGGGHGEGTVFKVNTDGSGFKVLKEFSDSDATYPLAGLVLSGTTLYGTTGGGGASSNGTVFQVETDGNGYAVLKQFTGPDGAVPRADLVVSGRTLYGCTSAGGGSNCGVVFALGYHPTIQAPPQTQTAEAGATVDVVVVADDDPPLKYQWFFNGNAITGCTNSDLCLSGVQATNIGAYSVIVTNLFGAVTSSPAILNVIPLVERRPVPAVNLMAQPGSALGLAYCDALGSTADWETMATMTLSSNSQFYFDVSEPFPPQRFYRTWQTGTPGLIPSLDLHMVPAITLTGNVGDSLRLDCINQFGPTNAWVTLDTVTLTNTSQLYFDVSAIQQPARLWRIVPVP